MTESAKGTLISLLASFLFGVLYYYSTMLKPLTGVDIFGWRIIFTLPCLTVFMIGYGYWPLVRGIWKRICKRRILLLPLCLSAALIGVQFWLFLWAPLNGKALDVSLGYLTMPLVMVVCGRFLYGERLQPLQKIAVLCALVGVANQLFRSDGLSWVVPVVALGFPVYFILRRHMDTSHLGGLWFDMLLCLPAAFFIVGDGTLSWAMVTEEPRFFIQLPLLGVISALAVAMYIVASRLLTLGLFGLLSYAEPVLLVGVSLLIGERIEPDERLTYIGVGLAMLFLSLEGAKSLRQSRHVPS